MSVQMERGVATETLKDVARETSLVTTLLGLCCLLDHETAYGYTTREAIMQHLGVKALTWFNRAQKQELVAVAPRINLSADAKGRKVFIPTENTTSLVGAYESMSYDNLLEHPSYPYSDPLEARTLGVRALAGMNMVELDPQPTDNEADIQNWIMTSWGIVAETIQQHPTSLSLRACLALGAANGIQPRSLIEVTPTQST